MELNMLELDFTFQSLEHGTGVDVISFEVKHVEDRGDSRLNVGEVRGEGNGQRNSKSTELDSKEGLQEGKRTSTKNEDLTNNGRKFSCSMYRKTKDLEKLDGYSRVQYTEKLRTCKKWMEILVFKIQKN